MIISSDSSQAVHDHDCRDWTRKVVPKNYGELYSTRLLAIVFFILNSLINSNVQYSLLMMSHQVSFIVFNVPFILTCLL